MSTIPIPVPAPVPVPASVLVDRELARRKKLRRQQQKGRILTGCREIDEYVLLGGFERGSVVGVSAEDDEMGLLIGLQTVAHLLVAATLEMIRDNQNDHGGGKTTAFSVSDHPRVTIVTMLPVNVLVPKLRQVLVNQLAAGLSSGGGLQNINTLVKRCLGNISISMVFDVEGLREVLGEIGGTLSSSLSPHDTVEEQEQEQQQRHVQPGQQQEKKEEQKQERRLLRDRPASKEDPVEAETEAFQNEPVVSIPIRSPAKPQPVNSRFKTEILDSEDEGEDEDGVEVEDPGNATDMSSELSSPPASLPDEFEEYEKLLQDSTPAPKRDENIPETTSRGSIDNNDNQTLPQTDSIEGQAGEGDGNTGQTQPSPDNKDSEPSTNTNAQPSPPAAENSKPPTNIDVQPPPPPPPPDMILITHTSALLNGLFTGRDKPAAHETMTLLSSQLRQLTSPYYDNRAPPLIMILNSTTTTTSASSVVMTTGEYTLHHPGEEQRPASREQQHQQQQQQQATTDPTLRSIFQHNHKTKPSFGTVFARLLDLHLLCTRIPRRQGQRQTPAARGGRGRAMGRGEPPLSTAQAGTGAGGISSPSHRFAWVVEVLLDERGVYEQDDFEGMSGEERGPLLETQRRVRRRCREQRWGAVEVEEGGGRVVDVVI